MAAAPSAGAPTATSATVHGAPMAADWGCHPAALMADLTGAPAATSATVHGAPMAAAAADAAATTPTPAGAAAASAADVVVSGLQKGRKTAKRLMMRASAFSKAVDDARKAEGKATSAACRSVQRRGLLFKRAWSPTCAEGKPLIAACQWRCSVCQTRRCALQKAHLWPSHTCVVCGQRAKCPAPGLHWHPVGLDWPVQSDGEIIDVIDLTDDGKSIGHRHSDGVAIGHRHSDGIPIGRCRRRSDSAGHRDGDPSHPHREKRRRGSNQGSHIQDPQRGGHHSDGDPTRPGTTDHGVPFGHIRRGPYRGEMIYDESRHALRDSDLECLFLELLQVFPAARREDYFIEGFGRAWRKRQLELDIEVCTDYRQRCDNIVARWWASQDQSTSSSSSRFVEG